MTSLQSIISLAGPKSAGGTVRPMPSSPETWRQIEIPKISGMWYFGDSFSLFLD
jgi:hypothetical protein